MYLSNRTITLPKQQRGYATLVVGFILLLSLTFVTIYSGEVGLLEQKNSANNVRYSEALNNAEQGIEQALAHINANRRRINSTAAGGWMNSSNVRWAACTDSLITPPCGNGTTNVYGTGDNWLYYDNVDDDELLIPPVDSNGNNLYQLHYMSFDANSDGLLDQPPVITIVSEGFSAGASATDTTRSRALLQHTFFFYRLVSSDGAKAPMLAAGNIGTGGNFSVVANPNGGGTNIPLTAWSNGDVTLTGTAQTCNLDSFLASASSLANYITMTDSSGRTFTHCPSCTCPAAFDLVYGYLSNSSIENYDILDNDGDNGINPDTTDFPADVFQYMFGVPTASYQMIKAQAQVISDCSTLNTASSGLYWYTGSSCSPSDTGSFDQPVLLISEGDVTLNGNTTFFGIIFAFSSNPAAVTTPMDVHLTGGPTLVGGVMSNTDIDMGNGSYVQRFDGDALTNLANAASARVLAKVEGSWSDY